MSWFVYILRCADHSLYCGVTTDLNSRVEAHNSGIGARYTRSRLPVQLVWFAQTQSKSEAFKEEFRIKRLHKHEKEFLVASSEEHRKCPFGGGKITRRECDNEGHQESSCANCWTHL
jgi:putative endonuclease